MSRWLGWNLNTFVKLAQPNKAVRDAATILALAKGLLGSKEVLVKLLRNATKMGDLAANLRHRKLFVPNRRRQGLVLFGYGYLTLIHGN